MERLQAFKRDQGGPGMDMDGWMHGATTINNVIKVNLIQKIS